MRSDWYCAPCEARREGPQGELRVLSRACVCSSCGALAHRGTEVPVPVVEDPYLYGPPSQWDLEHDPNLAWARS